MSGGGMRWLSGEGGGVSWGRGCVMGSRSGKRECVLGSSGMGRRVVVRCVVGIRGGRCSGGWDEVLVGGGGSGGGCVGSCGYEVGSWRRGGVGVRVVDLGGGAVSGVWRGVTTLAEREWLRMRLRGGGGRGVECGVRGRGGECKWGVAGEMGWESGEVKGWVGGWSEAQCVGCEAMREGVEDLLDKLRSIKRDGGIQGDARDAYVESHVEYLHKIYVKRGTEAEDHFDGILKITLSPQGFSKRIGIHTIQSISGFAA
ncbi:hypothetical protein Tco_1564213 [Tanacetum coccineum]